VRHGVADLRPVAGLEIGQEVQFAAVVCTVMSAAQGDDARRIVASAERSWDQVGWVDGMSPTDKA
jgi:hypothetical protein